MSVFANSSTVTVLQGEYRVSTSPTVVFSTVLGSCIAACIYDDQVGVGGMNHFLLASSTASERRSAPLRPACGGQPLPPADAYRRVLAPAEASLCKCLAKLAGPSLDAYRANAYKLWNM